MATAIEEKVTTQPRKPKYSLRQRWKMLFVMDSLLGQKFARVVKIVLICGCLIFAGFIALLVVQILKTPAITLVSYTAYPWNPREILEIALSIITVVVTCFTAIQVHMMKDINHMEMSHNIFDDNQTFRRDMHKAHEELRKLADSLTPDTDFDEIYLLADWENLRAFAYHHEYMGYLVFRDRLNFDIVFDTVAFPNWLINSPEAKKVIAAGREHTPDFWNGSTHLFLCYEIRRKYNKRNALRQELKACPRKEVRKAKKRLKKEAVLAQRDSVSPVTKLNTTENVLKNLWITEADYKAACEAWKEQYITLPE